MLLSHNGNFSDAEHQGGEPRGAWEKGAEPGAGGCGGQASALGFGVRWSDCIFSELSSCFHSWSA